MKIKNLFEILIVVALVFLPFSEAATTNSVGVGIGVTPGNIAPQIWMDTTTRELTDTFGNPITRTNNYAFTGEQLRWRVLVRDENGITGLIVESTVGPSQGTGNPAQAGCTLEATQPTDGATFGWASGVSFDSKTDLIYYCILSVEPGMRGQYWAQAVVTDALGAQDSFHEDSFFYFNPAISLTIIGAGNGLVFTEEGQATGIVRPGRTGYSQSILVRNTAASGSGVILDVDIKGTDFYDSSSSPARCPTTNQLGLNNFRYFATKGVYTTAGSATVDSEGYETIGYNWQNLIRGSGTPGSRLAQGTEATLTFKLNLPSPC
ncbi:MAG: hypothetical protein V1659_01600, partial [Candidatus Woesearchaeota archaeon]